MDAGIRDLVDAADIADHIANIGMLRTVDSGQIPKRISGLNGNCGEFSRLCSAGIEYTQYGTGCDGEQ